MRCLLSILFLLPLLSFAQTKKIVLNATFEKIEAQSKTFVTTVNVEKNGEVIHTEVTQNGKFIYALDTGAVYKVFFSKINYVGKHLMIDTREIPKKSRKKQTLRVEMSFFLDFDDVDFSFLETTPVSVARYDEQYKKLRWDKEYTKLINEKIAQILLNL